MSTEINNTSANSICIPRAFANISEARVRKVFDALNIFTIDRVDMVQRKNEKGDAYQRIFVHIKEWSETADARKAKERLLAGKELKIVYDDPWFWKASLNTWAPKPKSETAMYDRKPRIRLDFEDKDEEEDLPYDVRWGDEQARRKRYQAKKNAEAATQLLNDATQEDRRPYRERRIDSVYCEQDVKQGFRDRRLPRDREPRKDQRASRFTPRSPSRSPERDQIQSLPGLVQHDGRDYRDGHAAAIYEKKEEQKPLVIAPALSEQKPLVIAPALSEQKPVEEKKFVMNPDVKVMISTYLRIGINEITEEIYRNNAQYVRDLRRDDMDRQKEENAKNGIKPLEYRVDPNLPPKRRRGKIIS
jgi:hypothetical protein